MSLSVRHLLSVSLFCLSLLAAAQRPVPQADRIAAQPNLRATTRLAGHIPSWANNSVSTNAVPADTPLRLTFVLTRSAERQAAFDQLLADQQAPGSPSYHHWLTPQQIGQLYGPTQHDLDALSAWLSAQGLTVTETAPSRTFITVSASAGTIASALSVNFRSVLLNGPDGLPEATPRITNTVEPAIPTAFVPLVSAITGLSDTPVYPMLHSELAPLPNSAQPAPLGTSTSSGKHYIAPNDFAVLYDLNPVYNSGLNGAGQKIAIVGRSRVLDSDITKYESFTALPAKQPNVIIPPTGVDPGLSGTADQDEATLDVQRVFGTTPGVQADLIISTAATGGVQLAAQYNVQTLLDPVMSISFGSCEANAGQSGVTFWNTLFSQAAAEGISTFVSSGDSGAAACQIAGKAPVGVQARSINVICSSSYITCVGGTEFADFASPNTYWSPTNGPGLLTALSYIPEGAWNEPTVTSNNVTTYVVTGTGGGASAFIPKPAWQTGAGVPIDGARDVPDVSFSSSNHNGYFGCLNYTGADCVTFITFFSGTSAAAPSMASIATLLNQKTGSAQGNLNPLLYKLAASTPNAFHDATPASSGISPCDINTPSMCNNSTPGVGGLSGGLAGFALTSGYDQATGLGSLDVANFLSGSVSSEILTVSPAARSLTVTSGAVTGNTDLITVGSSVYGGAVSLGCTVTFNGPGSASSPPLCSLSPASVNVAANSSATSTLTIVTSRTASAQIVTSPSFTATSDRPTAPRSPAPRALPVGRITLCSLALLLLLPRRRSLRALRSFGRTLPLALLLLAGLGALSACSGTSTPASPNPLLVSSTNTSLTSPNPTIFAGSSGTFVAAVTNSGFNTTVAPTGTIQFFNGGSTPIATATLGAAAANTAASVTTSIPFSTPGSYTVFANYTGDKNFRSSSANIPFTVIPFGTTAGNYTVTITASGSGIPIAATSVALTVQ